MPHITPLHGLWQYFTHLLNMFDNKAALANEGDLYILLAQVTDQAQAWLSLFGTDAGHGGRHDPG